MALRSAGYTPGSMYARFHQRPSAFQYAEAWRQRRSLQSQQFLEQSSALASAFTSAVTSQTQGMAAISSQIALERLQTVTGALKSGINISA
jgi:hypothetical protein